MGPGEADPVLSPVAYWALLAEGRRAVGERDESREGHLMSRPEGTSVLGPMRIPMPLRYMGRGGGKRRVDEWVSG